MKCVCCGKRKKTFESFEHITENIDVCVDCSTLLYKLRDYINDKNPPKEEEIRNTIVALLNEKSTEQFKKWFDAYDSKLHRDI